MNDRREELHSKLKELLGSDNAYYQAPPSMQMKYPAIRYSKIRYDTKHADNMKYSNRTCYEIIVICKTPDHEVIDKLLDLPYCSYDRHYVSDNLNHDVLTLYY